MVRERGLEPPRVLPHKILSLARLPVPPLPHRTNYLIHQKVDELRNQVARLLTLN
jgi:hypothetical protein